MLRLLPLPTALLHGQLAGRRGFNACGGIRDKGLVAAGGFNVILVCRPTRPGKGSSGDGCELGGDGWRFSGNDECRTRNGEIRPIEDADEVGVPSPPVQGATVLHRLARWYEMEIQGAT
jgi:hypothetical protein